MQIRWKGNVKCQMEENGHDVVSDNYIRYTDKLVKQDGRWLIKEREQHFVITKKQDL